MDAIRFDALSRSLTHARSRRAALGALLVGTLGLLSRSDLPSAAAKNCKRIKDKKKRKKCQQKANETNAGVSPPPPPPLPAGPDRPADRASAPRRVE